MPASAAGEDGEVLALLRDGLSDAQRTHHIEEIRGEFLAIDSALARLESGDLPHPHRPGGGSLGSHRQALPNNRVGRWGTPEIAFLGFSGGRIGPRRGLPSAG